MEGKEEIFRPALIIVDVQEDFCPPNGTLAVPNGRAILPTITNLLSLPFTLKIATQDWHPPNHISFSSNHPSTSPYTSSIVISNPSNASETYTSLLWPDHCIQSTPGACLLPEIESFVSNGTIDKVVQKGMLESVEMYSAFYPPLKSPRVGDSGLVDVLRKEGITHVFVVGLAADYCVRATALDAKMEGWETVIVSEGTRAVDEETWEGKGRSEVEGLGVRIVGVDGVEVARVKGLSNSS